MSTLSTPASSAAQQIGLLIREARKRRKLKSVELGVMVGLSQSKISKLENGYSATLSTKVIEDILRVLRPSKAMTQRIYALLLHNSTSSIVPLQYVFNDFRYISKAERQASVIRSYTINNIPAPLQNLEYREVVLRAAGIGPDRMPAAIKDSLTRQDLLWEGTRIYQYIITEAALYCLPAGINAQLAQLDRLEQLCALQNIHIGIVPTQIGLPLFEAGNFTLYDEQQLYRPLGEIELETKDKETILQYSRVFAELEKKAVFGTEALSLIRKAKAYFGA